MYYAANKLLIPLSSSLRARARARKIQKIFSYLLINGPRARAYLIKTAVRVNATKREIYKKPLCNEAEARQNLSRFAVFAKTSLDVSFQLHSNENLQF